MTFCVRFRASKFRLAVLPGSEFTPDTLRVFRACVYLRCQPLGVKRTGARRSGRAVKAGWILCLEGSEALRRVAVFIQ